MEAKNLKTLETKAYQEKDEDGFYLGCFEPIYYLYEGLPHYTLEKASDGFDFPYSLLLQYFTPLGENQKPEYGDVVVIKIPPNILHCGVYLNNGEMIHVRKGHKHEIHKLKSFRQGVYSILRFGGNERKEQEEGN